MTNREISQRFAKGATSGRTSNKTIYIDGNVIYSYGAHWPMAVRVGSKAYINGDKVSVTTSKQTGYVAGQLAIEGFETAYISKAELQRMI